ncbi:MAG: B12-binding domain-containing radical SAM protein [Candidatus Eisenbacteria bacterium]|nr:B12-binding domain-containing radical SAM protein [Candidatus Eisenbacteria bacterium]
MAKVLLILPHLPQRMGTPYLGQQYVASALLAAGHDVRCLDMAAVRFAGTDADAVALAWEWNPDIVGMTLFTYNALRGYRLAHALRGLTRCLVAGGPHVTALPHEALEHGFDVAIAGEAEHSLVALACALERGDAWPALPGLHATGLACTPHRTLEDLDALPLPLESYDCYDASRYSAGAMVVPGGLMTSRGCPARCTFCANHVTGRVYRWRSAANVVAEMKALRRRHGVRHFPFWDDAFTARRVRLLELCAAIVAEPELAGCTWTCITPGNMVRPADLAVMREAGCVAINFGLESGDLNVLRDIRKGQHPDQVRDAVRSARDAGMTTIVNFMFGFPQEGVRELANTRAFMESIAPHTDYFNNRGVLVPFPGTEIYAREHERHSFTNWWLDPARIVDEPNVHVLDPRASQEYLEHDPTLDLDFFHYEPAVRAAIADCVRFKARHNARTMHRFTLPHDAPAPVGASTGELLRNAAASVG